MMMLLLKGLMLGLAIAMPLGPIGILCLNRTLAQGFWAGLAGGLGTALADGVYAALAAGGFAGAAGLLSAIDLPLKLGGGVFLLWLGIKSLRPAATTAARIGRPDLAGTIAATFALTLANPATIITFAAIFAGLGLAADAGAGAAAALVAGVFSGSLLWWLALSGGVALLRQRITDGFMRWSGRISGAVLILFGLYAVGSVCWG